MKILSLKFKIIFAVIGISLLLSVMFTFPSILKLNKSFIGDGWDNYEYASYQMLAANQIKELHYPFVYQHLWRYPVGFDFSRGFDSYLTVVTGALLTLIFSMPLGYNLTILILMTLNGALSYLFFASLTKSRILGAAGAIIYGFSFYTIAKAASHPNLLFVGGFPLFAYAVLNMLRTQSIQKRDFFLFFGAIILIALSSLQYLIMLFLSLVAVIVATFFIDKSILFGLVKKIIDSKNNLKLPIIVFVLVFSVLYFPYIFALMTGSFVFLDRSIFLKDISPSFFDYILPNSYLKLLVSKIVASPTPFSIEKAVFSGFIEILIFLAFIVKSNTKIKLFLVSIFSIFLLLSFGAPSASPLYIYNFLIKVPPFSSIIETGRFVVLFYFFETAAILLFLNSLTKKKNLIIAAVLIFCILERLPATFYSTDTLSGAKYIDVVKQSKTSAVVDIPVNLYYSRYNMLSLYYDKPIVNGYFHWSADGSLQKSFVIQTLLTRFICDEQRLLPNTIDSVEEDIKNRQMISSLKSYGINTLVVHKDDKFYHSVCTNVRTELTNLVPFTKSAALTSDSEEKQITGKSLDGYSRFNVYLPYDGIFYVDGVFLDPSIKSDFSITINGVPISNNYSWNSTYQKYAIELSPKNTINFPVAGGSTLSFVSKKQVHDAAFSIWYRYVESDANYVPNLPAISQIYDDSAATVYKLN